MTEPITAEEAKEILTPHLDDIGSCIERGWQRWRVLLAGDTELGVIISNRSRANLVYDFIRYEAMNTFGSEEEVTVSDSRGFLLLTFAEKIVMRFKKFRNDRLRTSSIPTQQSREYASQVLPGMDTLTHLVAGYLPDETGLGLHRAAITCSLEEDQLWVLELDLGIDQAVPAAPIPITIPQEQPDTIVRPKPTTEGTGQTASEER